MKTNNIDDVNLGNLIAITGADVATAEYAAANLALRFCKGLNLRIHLPAGDTPQDRIEMIGEALLDMENTIEQIFVVNLSGYWTNEGRVEETVTLNRILPDMLRTIAGNKHRVILIGNGNPEGEYPLPAKTMFMCSSVIKAYKPSEYIKRPHWMTDEYTDDNSIILKLARNISAVTGALYPIERLCNKND